jgi:hypothetical protein
MMSSKGAPYVRRESGSPRSFTAKDTNRLKSQIDTLLENDYSVLAKHPDTPHEALLTTFNNPLIMHYIRTIYQEYNLKDPLPDRYKQHPISENLPKHKTITLFKKQLDQYQTPPRENLRMEQERMKGNY